jgi:hypothetical protein
MDSTEKGVRYYYSNPIKDMFRRLSADTHIVYNFEIFSEDKTGSELSHGLFVTRAADSLKNLKNKKIFSN